MEITYFCPLHMTLINLTTWRAYKESDRLQAHEQVIRPLFNASTETYIYRGTVKERITSSGEHIKPVELKDESILIPQKGKYVFDKTQECITGHEYLWNATWHKRGSIVMVLGNGFDFSVIFPHCYNPDELSNPNSGESPSAVRLCQKKREENAITALFSASNGIEFMSIYAPDKAFEEIYGLAKCLCKTRDDRNKEPFNQILN